MSEETNPTNETQVDASQLNAAAGDAAVSQPEALTLEEINTITGKNYKTKEAALKSIQDMNSMAGRAADLEGKAKQTEVDSTVQQRLEAAELEAFLARNPQHEENLELLQSLAKANGVSLKEATNLPVYTSLLEKVTQAKENVSKRTIASSNNRVAQPQEEEDMSKVLGDPLKSAEFVVKKFMS